MKRKGFNLKIIVIRKERGILNDYPRNLPVDSLSALIYLVWIWYGSDESNYARGFLLKTEPKNATKGDAYTHIERKNERNEYTCVYSYQESTCFQCIYELWVSRFGNYESWKG